ncbi:hydrogenase nickel incorporation protein HypB, partial [candidate division WOR-3 bacterium]|nr:hydrogenase nickel incorporation protein HypB [candidate division WOR-3 bacterium]
MEIKILKKVMSANDAVAEEIADFFTKKGVFAVNLMGSPGSGKTTILEKTIEMLLPDYRIAVVEGDITTTIDAEKLSKFPIKITQVNTLPFGGDCHLEASWIKDAVNDMNLDNIDFLFIENIGNLVCPAEFKTGAHKNVLILSLPEGEDKPLKYPLAFKVSQLTLLSKLDLIDVLDYDVKKVEENIEKVHPGIEKILVSSRNGSGMQDWKTWLTEQRKLMF